MRGIKRFILVLFLAILGAPLAIGGAALIKDATLPTYLENFDYSTLDEMDFINKKIETVALSSALGNTSISVDDETINKLINKRVMELPGLPVFSDEIELTGVWTYFNDNELTFYSAIKYRKIETTMTLKLEIIDIDDSVKLSFKQLKIGKLPLPKSMLTYFIKKMPEYMDVELEEDYEFGEVNYDSLSVTVENSYINGIIEKNMNTNIILFKSVELSESKFTLNYELNEANEEVKALKDAITEVNNLVKNEELVEEVSSILDDNDEIEKVFKTEFTDTMESLKEKVENPDEIKDLTTEDEELLENLSESFLNLSEEKQNEVVASIEDTFDDLESLNNALQTLGLPENSSISDLIFGLNNK